MQGGEKQARNWGMQNAGVAQGKTTVTQTTTGWAATEKSCRN